VGSSVRMFNADTVGSAKQLQVQVPVRGWSGIWSSRAATYLFRSSAKGRCSFRFGDALLYRGRKKDVVLLGEGGTAVSIEHIISARIQAARRIPPDSVSGV
jgi:hypothetical protein